MFQHKWNTASSTVSILNELQPRSQCESLRIGYFAAPSSTELSGNGPCSKKCQEVECTQGQHGRVSGPGSHKDTGKVTLTLIIHEYHIYSRRRPGVSFYLKITPKASWISLKVPLLRPVPNFFNLSDHPYQER